MNSKMKSRSRIALTLTLIAMVCAPLSAHALDDTKERLVLAKKMIEILPAQPQIEAAVDGYISGTMATFSQKDRDTFRRAMLNVMNPKALEKSAIDAYVSTYTKKELAAMVEYYDKPEARSASEKQPEFAAKIYPEIIKMMDQAVIRLREKPSK